MQRVPVISKEGKALMPTKPSRARKWLRDGKAKIYKNDLNVFAIQPSHRLREAMPKAVNLRL